MKLSSGKRIGQSGHELITAAVFSFTLHILAFGAAFFFYTVTPRFHAPPYYNVNLVNLSDGVAQGLPPAGAAPDRPQPEQEPQAKEKKAKSKKTASAKTKAGGMPELAKPKAKSEKRETDDIWEEASAKSSKDRSGATEAKTEGVAVTVVQQDPRLALYLKIIHSRIALNWNPPPDSKDAKVRVLFSVKRSGWIDVVTLVEDQSAGTFGFKQAAIRAIRSCNPFPALPDEFPSKSVEFSADLKAVD